MNVDLHEQQGVEDKTECGLGEAKMASNSKHHTNGLTDSESFDWDEFQGFLVGLQTGPDKAEENPSETGVEGDDPWQTDEPEAPALPRVHSDELKIHRLRARRRKIHKRPESPDADLNDTDAAAAALLANKLAPQRPDTTVQNEAVQNGHEATQRPAGFGLSSIDRALDRELQLPADPPRHLQRDGMDDWPERSISPRARRRASLQYSAAGLAIILSGVAMANYWTESQPPLPRAPEVASLATAMPAPAAIGQDGEAIIPPSPEADPAIERSIGDLGPVATKAAADREPIVPRMVKVSTVTAKLNPIDEARASVYPAPTTLSSADPDPIAIQPTLKSEANGEIIPVNQAPSPVNRAPEIKTAALTPADEPPEPLAQEPEKASIVVAPSQGREAAADDKRAPEPASEPEVTLKFTGQPVSKGRLDAWMRQGLDLMNVGDLMSARLLFERVAQGGDPRGAEAMASTFDPKLFKHLHIVGLSPDAESYDLWRRRARELSQAR